MVDTSVIIQWFHQSGELHIKEAQKLLDDFRDGRVKILIPDALALELLNVLIKGKSLSVKEAIITLNRLFDMPIEITEISLPVLEASSLLMEEYNLASYDAYFLALAQYEECKLISDDQKAHGQIKDGSVLMLEDYPIDIPT